MTATDAPIIHCARCGLPLDAYLQHGFGYFEDAWYVTCTNEAEHCRLYDYTFAAANYPPANLDTYLHAPLPEPAGFESKEHGS